MSRKFRKLFQRILSIPFFILSMVGGSLSLIQNSTQRTLE